MKGHPSGFGGRNGFLASEDISLFLVESTRHLIGTSGSPTALPRG
jgi:hypothetical protein